MSKVMKISARLPITVNLEATAAVEEECIAEAKNYPADQFSKAGFLPKGNVSESIGDESSNVKDC